MLRIRGGTVYTLKEATEIGTFDPPCPYLEARCFMGTVQVCTDGDIYMNALEDRYAFIEPGPQWRKRVLESLLKKMAS